MTGFHLLWAALVVAVVGFVFWANHGDTGTERE